MNVRPATRADVPRVATLHATRIDEGFLPTLGLPFLSRLYRRVLASPDAFLLVATADKASRTGPVGFVAGAVDLGALYRRFLVRDGVMAGLRAAPRLARSARRVVETLRYPAGTDDLPPAEILAVAVDAAEAGRGIGRALVDAALAEFRARGVPTVKVVAGGANDAALRLYRGCGFATHTRVAVHRGVVSEVLVWSSS